MRAWTLLIIMSEKLPARSNSLSFDERGFEEWKSKEFSQEILALFDKMSSITRNPIGLRKEKGEKGPPLRHEDFKLVQNNFHLFFAKDNGKKINIGRIYRTKEAFQQCLADHPEEVQKFVDELGTYDFQRWDIDRATNTIIRFPPDPRGPEMERKLYEAYLLMREYVDDDRELFT
jgi:hypothetical protein